jgi:cell division protein FtsL
MLLPSAVEGNMLNVFSSVLRNVGTSYLTRHNTRIVFGNKVLREMFGSERDEVTNGWTKLQYEQLHDLYTSPCIIRVIK